MAEQQEQQQEEKQEKKGGKKKWLFLVLAVVLITVGVGGYFLVGPTDLMALVEGDEDIYKIQMDTFTVNLADDANRRYLRADITIECYSDDGIEEIKKKKHRIRDKIITILSQKTVSDFKSDQNFEQVKVGLSESINDILSEDTEIKSLYFEDFVIQ